MDERGNSLSERVYLSLRESIVKGEFYPGVRLLVLEIANSLKISQAPVREAMERLKQEGLLISNHNKGSFVAEIKQEEIEEIYALRELIEWDAVKRSIPDLQPSDFTHLIEIYKSMKRAAENNDLFQLIDLDMEFHRFFFTKSGNKTILQIWDQIHIKIKRFLSITNILYFPDLITIAEGHMPLIEALQTGNEKEVEKRFIEHMKEVWWRMNKKKDSERG
ncbi:GntR family transcriptional regulator [Cohnella silvisoli]|uniref:GntR family transcriptional regulator n=1 Tax=Cohnella silvisoli TaxID=2873699 RepID=A0ABV1L3E8_9BACL|nr:GntR family transcriptional regulator [Cohnella silvisoli]MCD9026093.1 GntR family transcriptional regulator [Cohnella silvisoli]